MYSLLFQFFSNATKAGFWLVFSVFSFSNSGVDHKLSPSFLLEDTYVSSNLGIADSITNILERSLVFESRTMVSSSGISFTSIELKLDFDVTENKQLFKIIISKPTKDINTVIGKHEVTGSFNSLLSEFNGVFGFININDLDEKPYFIYKGSLFIKELNQQSISGRMNLSFKNTEGRMAYVSRKFEAQRKESLTLQ
ncbi:hypothetical protein [Zobellia nedashkovskayae]|uniref:hypothetical protein n=1 Tax=Zobellia nedashkovskayae TaxID=2779510 RepID=UPI00188AEFB0|nr:hypothetical protein [Zobellia nedashkovskayae]